MRADVRAGVSKASERQEGGSHYKRLSPEPWEVMDGWNRDHFIGFLRYSVLKRLARWSDKADDPLMEVRKCIHELERLAEALIAAESAPEPLQVAEADPNPDRPVTGQPGPARYGSEDNSGPQNDPKGEMGGGSLDLGRQFMGDVYV